MTLDNFFKHVIGSANCPLTGTPTVIYQEESAMRFSYETRATGKVRYSDMAGNQLLGLSPEQKQILAGICRNKSIKNEEPLLITSQFITQLQNQNIPYSFEARARHLLQYLYDKGGRERKRHNLNSVDDSPISYSSPDQFVHIIKYLKQKNWIDYDQAIPTNAGHLYQGIYLTDLGIDEIERGLPQIPLIDLVSQKVSLADPELDREIEHSRSLFFGPNSTFESKRSACESLCFVLEPLREKLKGLFEGDTEIFFNLVNNFTVRHNKIITKQIEHE